jgi:spore coat protein A
MGGRSGSESGAVDRRTMLKLGIAGAAATALPLGGLLRMAARGDVGASPHVPSFSVPLRRPPRAVPVGTTPEGLPMYVMHQREAEAQILPGFPKTRIWGYDGTTPGPTVRMKVGEKIVVRQVNGLQTPTTVHMHGGDTAPEFDGHPLALVSPGTYFDHVYTGEDESATMWYHDHAIFRTGFNVYQGLAGFFFVSDANERSLPLPKGRFDVEMAIQDRLFDRNAQLVYPFDDPETGLPVRQGVFGDTLLVNGQPTPFMKVERRKYRFRILNGCNARALRLKLSTGEAMTVIGNEHQLFEHPVDVDRFSIYPAERMNVVIDFAKYPVGSKIELRNVFQDDPGDPFDPMATRRVMRFDVDADAVDPSRVPNDIAPQEPDGTPTVFRDWVFEREGGEWVINGKTFDADRVDAEIVHDTTEVWTLINQGGGWIHPIHPHLIEFKILDRNGKPPAPYEIGFKDVVSLGPNDVVRIIFTVDEENSGLYVYHCHNLEHEDHDMMTQIRFLPREGSGS